MKKIRVLIVDDSVLIRKLLTEIISKSDFLEVVGSCSDPYEAREKIKALNPDVITLDIEMPRMDGITFLKNLIRLRPMPVVMISTLTQKGSDITLQALELGAIDFIAKPKISVMNELPFLAEEIVTKIRIAANAKVSALKLDDHKVPVSSVGKACSQREMKDDIELIAIGASTGGVEATKVLLETLPKKMPPIVIVQHMPPGFTSSYANRLNNLLEATVIEFVATRDQLMPGHIYIANGNQHIEVQKRGSSIYGLCIDSDPVNRHKPSVDVLFDSVANAFDGHVLAVLLTGMGVDGAEGMSHIRKTGAITVAQDEVTSIVWGMPRVAIELGAANYVLPLTKIGPFLVERCYG